MNKEKMKEEALNRLAKLGIMNRVKEGFAKDGTLFYSDQTSLGGILYLLSEAPGWYEKIRNFEEEHNALVYHAIHSRTVLGDMLTLLFVSQFEEEWEFDNNDLDYKDENGFTVFSYVYNLSHDDLSEFGTVIVKEAGGGLVRTV